MSKLIRVAAVLGCAALALAFVVANARALDVVVDVPCTPLAQIPDREAFAVLTRDQWQAARALFFSSPQTPTALPPGDRALLRKGPSGQAMLIFVDGEEACAPIVLPPAAAEFLDEIAKGVVTHPPGKM